MHSDSWQFRELIMINPWLSTCPQAIGDISQIELEFEMLVQNGGIYFFKTLYNRKIMACRNAALLPWQGVVTIFPLPPPKSFPCTLITFFFVLSMVGYQAKLSYLSYNQLDRTALGFWVLVKWFDRPLIKKATKFMYLSLLFINTCLQFDCGNVLLMEATL